jgi:hypothetical protein
MFWLGAEAEIHSITSAGSQREASIWEPSEKKKKEKTLERAANEKHPAKFARLRGFCAMLGPNAGICITNLSM